jgi:hypothetical protein
VKKKKNDSEKNVYRQGNDSRNERMKGREERKFLAMQKEANNVAFDSNLFVSSELQTPLILVKIILGGSTHRQWLGRRLHSSKFIYMILDVPTSSARNVRDAHIWRRVPNRPLLIRFV